MKKKELAEKMNSHIATAKDRKKDSYLSADSRVWSKKGKQSLNIAKGGHNEKNKMQEGRNEQERN